MKKDPAQPCGAFDDPEAPLPYSAAYAAPAATVATEATADTEVAAAAEAPSGRSVEFLQMFSEL